MSLFIKKHAVLLNLKLLQLKSSSCFIDHFRFLIKKFRCSKPSLNCAAWFDSLVHEGLFLPLCMCRERERKKRRRAAGCNKRAAAAADKAHAPRHCARAAAACHIFRTVLTPVGMFGISINPRIKRARAVLVLLSCVPPLYHHAVTLLYLLICKVERKLRLPRAPALSLDAG